MGKREADYARDIRGYAQREMPILQQESIQPTGSYFVNSQIGRERVDLPTKAAIYCNLGAAEEQEEEVAAIYIRCEMFSFRQIARGMQPSYYDASLGIATSDTVAAAIDERLEYLVSSLGARFYRDMNEKKQESDEAR